MLHHDSWSIYVWLAVALGAAKSIAAEKNEKKIKGPRGKQFDLVSDIRNIAKNGEKDVIP